MCTIMPSVYSKNKHTCCTYIFRTMMVAVYTAIAPFTVGLGLGLGFRVRVRVRVRDNRMLSGPVTIHYNAIHIGIFICTIHTT